MLRRDLLCLGMCSLALGCRRASEPEARDDSPTQTHDALGSLDAIPVELRPAFDVSVHRPAPA